MKDKKRPKEYDKGWFSDMTAQTTQPLKQQAIDKFKDYDFKGALTDFEAVLQKEPNDVPTLFNLACCHAMQEDSAKAFYCINRAVELGFKDFERIRTHERLAFLRVQPEYDAFAANQFRTPTPQSPPNVFVTETPTVNIQDALKSLHQQYDDGLISHETLMVQTKKLFE
jgi:tetratricopeptide (TPR) repeat protein